jgi:hypothetical protein
MFVKYFGRKKHKRVEIVNAKLYNGHESEAIAGFRANIVPGRGRIRFCS